MRGYFPDWKSSYPKNIIWLSSEDDMIMDFKAVQAAIG